MVKYCPVISQIYEGLLPPHRETPQIYCHSGENINESPFAKADHAVCERPRIKTPTNQTARLKLVPCFSSVTLVSPSYACTDLILNCGVLYPTTQCAQKFPFLFRRNYWDISVLSLIFLSYGYHHAVRSIQQFFFIVVIYITYYFKVMVGSAWCILHSIQYVHVLF